MKRSMFTTMLAAMLLLTPSTSLGQTTTFQDLLLKKEEWPTFATEGKKFQFEGRFEGRTANTIKITRFDIVCNLPSNATFPHGIKSGQRIEVIGRFLSENDNLSFIVSRILIKDTDIDRLRSLAKDVPTDQPAKLLDLAAEYQPDAEFYGDTALQMEIAAIRNDSIRRLQVMAHGDVTKLTELLQQGRMLGIKPELVQSLQFERIYAAAREPTANVDVLVAEIKEFCPGWDRLVPPIPERLRREFDEDAVSAFLDAPEADRNGFHRLLYKSLRLRQIHAVLKPDGSNGLELSNQIRTEFGDADPLAAVLEDREVRYRLTQLTTLSRLELKGLTELLTRLNRDSQISATVRDWLLAQERKIGTTTLAGLLRTADEYLFAGDLLPSDEYQQKGMELLKQAWASAVESSPTDAEQIADRLKRLGWERLNNVWMTNAQMNSLPKDNVQLAIREGRIVRGMTAEQVIQTLGQPTRISRIASKRSVCELWSFEEGQSTAGMVIRFRRSVTDSTAASTVEDFTGFK